MSPSLTAQATVNAIPGSSSDVTPLGDEHVNDLAELIDRPVHIPPLPSNLQVGLVHEPAITHGMPAGAR